MVKRHLAVEDEVVGFDPVDHDDVENVDPGQHHAKQHPLDSAANHSALSDIAAFNVSIAKHGFVPKLPNDPTKYFDGQGGYTVPPGAASMLIPVGPIGANYTANVGELVMYIAPPGLPITIKAPSLAGLSDGDRWGISSMSPTPTQIILDGNGATITNPLEAFFEGAPFPLLARQITVVYKLFLGAIWVLI